MKKLGQKLSFLTKIMLVIGLLISNLSSLSVVFAYEAPADVVVSLNEEILEVKYTKELDKEVKAVNVIVYESYTYLDGTPETFDGTSEKVKNVYPLTAEELLEAKEGTLELAYDSIFANQDDTVNNFELFDGTYSVKVEIVDVTDYSEEPTEEPDTTVAEGELTDTTLTEEEIPEVQNAETEITVTDDEFLNEVVTHEESSEDVVTEVVLAYGTYEEKMTHDSGLNIKLFDSTGAEIALVNGKYPVSAENSTVTVVAQILAGGLNPTDQFKYDGEEFFAYELIQEEFSSATNFGGRLFGEYELPVEVEVLKKLAVVEELAETEEEVVEIEEIEETTLTEEGYEEVIYTDSVKVLYESYEMNAELLNMVASLEGYGKDYLFYSDAKDGVLYILPGFEAKSEETTEETVVTKTMLDLYNMLNVAVAEEDENAEPIITYTLLKNGINVLESYVPASEEDGIEDYLATVALDETVEVVLANKGLTITYRVVVALDLDNDNMLTQNDVLELINQFVGESEITDIEKSDLYDFNGEVNSLDVLYLNQLVNTKSWEAELTETDAILDATLDVKFNDKELSEENYLTSGDEFTVDYVLSLTDYEVNGIAGVFNYDKTLFELVSVKVANEWLGNEENGKFLYLGEESLTGPELETSEPEDNEILDSEDTEAVTLEEETEEDTLETVTSVDYVVVTATFRALGATSEESNNVITLKDVELFNSTTEGVTYYNLDETTVSSEVVEVVASEDNTLSYLEVAGVVITLEDGVYEYEITVDNDVTVTDLKYILGNVAANVTSIICPEELVEGSNTVVITVTSEAGVSQDYTITVIREEAPEETTTQVNYNNNYTQDDNENDAEIVVTPGTQDDDTTDNDKDEEDSNLSRIIIIILILLVIAGLVYLIFKDDEDEETKKANKDVNRLEKETLEPEVKNVNKTSNNKPNNKSNNKTNNNNKNKISKNKKKER